MCHLLWEVFGNCLAIVQPFLHGLSDAEQQLLIDDFNRGGRAIAAVMSAKLGFWRCLPWRMAAILCGHAAEARVEAKACLDLYDQLPDPTQHHRLSSLCLAPGSLVRNDLLRFIDGDDFSSMSSQTLQHLLPLKFMPVTERVIESKHGAIASNLAGKRRKRSPVTVSLFSGRLKELTLRLDESPEILQMLLQNLESVRNAHRQAEVFDLLRHPWMQELLSHDRPHSTKFEARVRDIVYHCDHSQQYMSVGKVTRDLAERHREHTRVQNRRRAALVSPEELGRGDTEEPRPPWSHLLLEHMVLHVKRRGVGCIFSFPAKAVATSSLTDYMRTPHGSLPPTCALATTPVLPGDGGQLGIVAEDALIEDDDAWAASFDEASQSAARPRIA